MPLKCIFIDYYALKDEQKYRTANEQRLGEGYSEDEEFKTRFETAKTLI